MDPDVERAAVDAIARAGYHVERLWRLYPPGETGGDAEVLFLGRRRGVSAEAEALTAYVPDTSAATAIICSGC